MRIFGPVPALSSRADVQGSAPPTPYALKKTLIERVAKLLRALHDHGVNHRDYYLCRLLLDKRNGNKDLAATVKHLTEDELVAWGWEPGTDISGNTRAPVPIPKPEFNRIVREWARLGAA